MRRKRQMLQATKDNIRFEIAGRKIKSNHDLLRDDLKSLMKTVKEKTNCLMKSKMNELCTQRKSCRHQIDHLVVGAEDRIFDGIILDTNIKENVGTCRSTSKTDSNNIYIYKDTNHRATLYIINSSCT